MCSVNILSAFVISHLVPLWEVGQRGGPPFTPMRVRAFRRGDLALNLRPAGSFPGQAGMVLAGALGNLSPGTVSSSSGLGPPLPAAALSTENGKAQGCGQHTEASRTRQPFCSKFSVLPSSSSRPIKPSLIHSWSANEQEQSQLRSSRSAVQAWGRKSVYIV